VCVVFSMLGVREGVLIKCGCEGEMKSFLELLSSEAAK